MSTIDGKSGKAIRKGHDGYEGIRFEGRECFRRQCAHSVRYVREEFLSDALIEHARTTRSCDEAHGSEFGWVYEATERGSDAVVEWWIEIARGGSEYKEKARYDADPDASRSSFGRGYWFDRRSDGHRLLRDQIHAFDDSIHQPSRTGEYGLNTDTNHEFAANLVRMVLEMSRHLLRTPFHQGFVYLRELP